MKLIVSPHAHPFAFLKPLLWINLLSAGSIAGFWVLGIIGIKSAQANSLDQQTVDFQERQQEQPTDWSEFLSSTGPPSTAKQVQTTGENQQNAELLPEPISVAHSLPQSWAVAVSPTTNPSLEVEDGVKENAFIQAESETLALKPSLPPIQSDAPGQSSPLEELTPFPIQGTPENDSPESVEIAPVRSNPTVAQLPSLPLPPLPVPSNPIPSSTNSNSAVGQLPSFPQTPGAVPISPSMIPGGGTGYNPAWGQFPSYPQTPQSMPMGATNYNPGWGQYPGGVPQTPSPVFVPVTAPPMGGNYNPGWGQYPGVPPTAIMIPMPATGFPMGATNYNPNMGQASYVPQIIIIVPMPATGFPMGATNYNPGMGQFSYAPQPPQAWPIPPMQNQAGFNAYNPGMGQSPYFPQTQAPLPAPINPNASGFYGYNPGMGQSPSFSQNQAPLPAPINPNASGFNGYNPGMGQSPYFPQSQAPLPLPVNHPAGFNGYNPGMGQPSYFPQSQAPLPLPVNHPAGFNGYNPGIEQVSYSPQAQAPWPGSVNGNLADPNSSNLIVGQSPVFGQTPPTLPNAPAVPTLTPEELRQLQPEQQSSLLRGTALQSPSLQAQGSLVVQGDSSVARGRLAGLYPLTPRVLFGATLDLTSDDSGLADSPNQGLNINELYFATAPFDNLPNLRFVVGQLDLTSYFDRNSFAKDGVTHFFNPAFQTNPALSATGISSRPGVLVNWTVADNIEAKAAAFSSAGNIGDFALDGFAGEVGIRYGNAIIRGTYATARDAGSNTGFQEIFSIPRGDGEFGLQPDDREEAYGLNAEYFIPNWNMGVFGRYGRYINRELDAKGTSYSFGVSFLDVFTQNDRLGLAYGQNLSNNQGREKPDVLELFYDFRFLPNLRIGFTLQQRDGFSQTDIGVRVKTEFDVIPREN